MDEDEMIGHRGALTSIYGGKVLYQACKAFLPAGSGEVALEINDFLEVAENSSTSAPAGWLLGMNQRTGSQGYFPCKLKLLSCILYLAS